MEQSSAALTKLFSLTIDLIRAVVTVFP
ncbi:hypothetical protein NC652_028203 [Populus alba x Populus x berolinensis]|uniref:Uncharacterized protein n=1 Tax=Populus alba x Populus x berolinensis TaxID=444605 RepID=A0AAD6M764_9ROSI|nr:hypothetical protein NC652_028203 [Populus alba x Populus x berolinensis]KAJ6979996.1 hypothetical protein NC653_027967 [Populus alba x Populus x berolinensis]